MNPEQSFDRLPPFSMEAERYVLGSMMLDRGCVADILVTVEKSDFYQADHQMIFGIICDLYNSGRPTETPLVHEELVNRKLSNETGGASYLATILGEVVTASAASHYAKIVKEKSILRGLLKVSYESLRRVYEHPGDGDSSDLVASTITELSSLISSRKSTEVIKLSDVLHSTYDQLESGQESPLIRFGFDAIDSMIGGIQEGEMVVVGARPSMGKSTFGRQVAVRAARQCPVALVWLEEGPSKVARNLLSAECRIENSKLRRGRGALDASDWTKLAKGAATLSELPIYIIPRAFRLNAIRAACGHVVAKHGVKLIIIDYLQKVQAPGDKRYEMVTNASMGLSQMFKELQVAGIVLAQLSREVSHREDKRPIISDLRESGQIEQDADGIIFIHREDYYRVTDANRQNEPLDQIAELSIAKWRDAVRGGVAKLQSDMKYQRFDDNIHPF